MRVLILGGGGMLGHKVFQVLSEQIETYATFRTKEGVWKTFPLYENVDSDYLLGGVDVREFDSVIRAFIQVKPDVVVNCVGITKQVEQAKDPVISIKVNALFPHLLADLCQMSNTRLIHISTDCVFNGKQGNYKEEDPSDAEDLYGRTKYLGEVKRKGCVTLRTSIIGRDFTKKSGLLEWFLSNRGTKINGYKNAIFSGFTTQSLAEIILHLIIDIPELSGLYHVSSDPISKYELLTQIRDEMDLDIRIEGDEEYKMDRSLDSTKFRNETGFDIPEWDTMISDLANDETPYDEWRKEHHAAVRK